MSNPIKVPGKEIKAGDVVCSDGELIEIYRVDIVTGDIWGVTQKYAAKLSINGEYEVVFSDSSTPKEDALALALDLLKVQVSALKSKVTSLQDELSTLKKGLLYVGGQ